ncbi:MAG: Methylamine utilization protein MauE [Actinomycetota bacterium]|nr:Methylamine utilization protein MauE [Actinomycetota bacterium]
MSLIPLLAGWILAVVFAWGALAKLVQFRRWQDALEAYRLPPGMSSPASAGVPVAELAVVGLLVSGHALAGSGLCLMLLAAFSLALLTARQKGSNRLPCGCFGRATLHDYRLLVARNAGLTLLAALVLINGHDRLLADPIGPTSAGLLPVALVTVGGIVLFWVARELAAVMRRP